MMMKQFKKNDYWDFTPSLWATNRSSRREPSTSDTNDSKLTDTDTTNYCTNCNECKNNNDKEN